MTTTVYAARQILTLDPAKPVATHVAVREGRIVAVGDITQMRALGAFEINDMFADLVLMPGLVEGHCHLKEGDMWRMPYLGWFDRKDPKGKVWRGLRSMSAVVDRLQAIDTQMHKQGISPEVPLVAWGFDHSRFVGHRSWRPNGITSLQSLVDPCHGYCVDDQWDHSCEKIFSSMTPFISQLF